MPSQLCGNFRNGAANRSVCRAHWFTNTVMNHRALCLALPGKVITVSKIRELRKCSYCVECPNWDPTRILAQWSENSKMKINGMNIKSCSKVSRKLYKYGWKWHLEIHQLKIPQKIIGTGKTDCTFNTAVA